MEKLDHEKNRYFFTATKALAAWLEKGGKKYGMPPSNYARLILIDVMLKEKFEKEGK